MIKKSAYIRKFTPQQVEQLEAIEEEQAIATAKNILLFALEKYSEHKSEIARLNRIIAYKQSKIERLQDNL